MSTNEKNEDGIAAVPEGARSASSEEARAGVAPAGRSAEEAFVATPPGGVEEGASASADALGRQEASSVAPETAGVEEGASAPADALGRQEASSMAPETSGREEAASASADASGPQEGASASADALGRQEASSMAPETSGREEAASASADASGPQGGVSASADALGPQEASAGSAKKGRARRLVHGRVSGLVKGGFEVQVPGAPLAFCSLSHMDIGRVTDASSFLDRDLDFEILTSSEPTGRTRLSRRRLLEREERVRLAELWETMVPPAVVEGRVVRLTEFAAFLDLGGIEGMVHRSELSHLRVAQPADVLHIGQEVQARVLGATRRQDPREERRKRPKNKRAAKSREKGRSRSELGRVSLSIKAVQEDPWSTAAERFKPWHVADGRIARVTEFGAFVELAPGVEALLHASEVPAGALEKLEEASKGGALMAVLVLQVDTKRRRIGLAAAPGGLAAGERVEPVRLRVGKPIVGRVQEVQSETIVLRLGPGQSATISNMEMGTERGADHKKDFPLGTEIEAEVLRVEGGGRRAVLSRKRHVRREERAEVQKHMKTQGAEGFSKLGDLLAQAREKARG